MAEKNNLQYSTFIDEMSVNVLLMAIAVFVFAKQHLNKSFKNEKTKNRLSYLSKCTFGVYLVHPLIIDCLDELYGFINLSISPILLVPLTTFIVFICSMIISASLNKIPFVQKWLL